METPSLAVSCRLAEGLLPKYCSRCAWPGIAVHLYRGGDLSGHPMFSPEAWFMLVVRKGHGRLFQRREGVVLDNLVTAGSVVFLDAGAKQIWSGTLPECVTLSIQAGERDLGAHGEMDLLETALGQDPFVSQLAALLASDMSCANHVPNGTVWTSTRRALVAHVWRRYSKSTSPEPNANSISGPKLTHVIDFVGTHLDVGISLDQMAAVAGMGRFHFSRMFKAAVGLTPMAFVERARIERAKTLIGEGRHSLAEIGLKVGFKDKSHFTRRFRRHTGLSPKEFMRQFNSI